MLNPISDVRIICAQLGAVIVPSHRRVESVSVRREPESITAVQGCVRGDTEMGRGLYPRAPDMRKDTTQALSDGELFYIIENGVRLTGMPAWATSTPEGEQASWHLVQFFRHLPKLTEGELADMNAMNPKSADDRLAEEEARRFLEGGSRATTTPAPMRHRHSGGTR